MYHFERTPWSIVHMHLNLALFGHRHKEQFLYPKVVYPVLKSAQFIILDFSVDSMINFATPKGKIQHV